MAKNEHERHDTISKRAQEFIDRGERVWDLIVATCPTCGYHLITAPGETGPAPACRFCATTKAQYNLMPGPGRDSSEPMPTAIPRQTPVACRFDATTQCQTPAQRLDPAALEERIAELERRQQADARWIGGVQDVIADLAARVAKLELRTGND